MKHCQLVIGPAGSGKSTYCSTIVKYAEYIGRRIDVINLDPAAEHFDYNMVADIRDLIQIDDVMEDDDLRFGPNGGLVYCMEFLVENRDWFEEAMGDEDSSYVLLDCPGQIELYTHLDVMRQLVDMLQNWQFYVCGVFLIDSRFLVEPTNFLSGVLTALSAMVGLEIPQVTIISKMDLLNKRGRKRIERFLEPDCSILDECSSFSSFSAKYQSLSETIGTLIEDYSLVKLIPLNIKDEESIGNVLMSIDNALQYGEDLDVKIKDLDPSEGFDDDNGL